MAKLRVTHAQTRKTRAKAAGFRPRSKTFKPGIAIVGLEEGGLGWRVTTDKGAPEKLRFGRVLFAPDGPVENVKFAMSVKAIDQAFREVTSMELGRSLGTQGKKRISAMPTKGKSLRLGRAARQDGPRLSDSD
jgi:hypothetical protein